MHERMQIILLPEESKQVFTRVPEAAAVADYVTVPSETAWLI